MQRLSHQGEEGTTSRFKGRKAFHTVYRHLLKNDIDITQTRADDLAKEKYAILNPQADFETQARNKGLLVSSPPPILLLPNVLSHLTCTPTRCCTSTLFGVLLTGPLQACVGGQVRAHLHPCIYVYNMLRSCGFLARKAPTKQCSPSLDGGTKCSSQVPHREQINAY